MNIELSLLAVMLKTGDFSPLQRDEITEDHFETHEGKILYNFISTYGTDSDGAAKYPSLSIVKARFGKTAVELPELDEADNVANLTHEVKLAKLKSTLRQIAEAAEAAASSAEDPLPKTTAIMAQLRKATEQQQRANHISLATGFEEVVENYINGELLPDGIPWPWPLMTHATKGIHKKEFIVIAGRPKSRKTFTSLRVAMDALRTRGERILIFSPEMPPRQIFLRCIAHLCDLPYRDFKDGSMAAGEQARLFEAAEMYGRVKGTDDDTYQYQLAANLPHLKATFPSLDIVQSTGRDTTWMASQIELYEPTLVVCDSFYRQRPSGGRKNDTDWKAISALSREMKDIFMDTNVAGIGTHQLNRGAQNGIGDLSSLALADAIGADADGIYQVLTFKVDGEDVSALVNLGGREVPFDGVIFKSKPCYDYEEVGEIKNKQQILDLLKQDDAQAAKEENDKVRAKLAADASEPRRVGKPSGAHADFARRPKTMGHSKFSAELEAAAKDIYGDNDNE